MNGPQSMEAGSVTNDEMAKQIAEYVALGLRVVKLYATVRPEVCSCWQGDNCPDVGKHPAGKPWGMTNDEDEVFAWWGGAKTYNVGVALGDKHRGTGPAVIDVEADSDEATKELSRLGLDKFPTPTWSSGRGLHRLFLWQPELPRKATDKPRGIEFRIGGNDKLAQSVLPPSLHRTGRRYAWLPGFGLDEVEIAALPEALLEVILGKPQQSRVVVPRKLWPKAQAFLDAGTLYPNKGRRDTVFAVGCDLARCGWTLPDAERAIMAQGRKFDLTNHEINDLPRQIASAFETAKRDAAEAPQLPAPPPIVAEPWQPFPVDALPETLRAFVSESASSIGCDEAFLALPALTVAGAAIGMTRSLHMKGDYIVPPILWSAIIGESGSGKTPALNAVLAPVRERESILREQHDEAQREHEDSLELFEKARSTWRSSKTTEAEPPKKPAEPPAPRAMTVDATVEALAPVMADNPRGLLLARDELAGWFGSFDRYAQGKGGGDEAFYLSAYNGVRHDVDRRTGNRRVIHVPRAALWIAGGIQPGVFRRAIGQDRRESGLLARLMVCEPPARPQRWSEDEVSIFTRQSYIDLIDRLYGLDMDVDEAGRERPRAVRLSVGAKRLWVSFHDRHAGEMTELTGDMAAAWSKLRDTAARIALVIHEVKLASGGDEIGDELSIDTMSHAVMIVEWLKGETRRVYGRLTESDAERASRQADEKLLAFVTSRDGSVAVRDVLAGCRWLGTADEAEAALERLAQAGKGAWVEKPSTPQGGRPTRVFCSSAVSTTLANTGKIGCADADAQCVA